jgi:hypothetical protein
LPGQGRTISRELQQINISAGEDAARQRTDM